MLLWYALIGLAPRSNCYGKLPRYECCNGNRSRWHLPTKFVQSSIPTKSVRYELDSPLHAMNSGAHWLPDTFHTGYSRCLPLPIPEVVDLLPFGGLITCITSAVNVSISPLENRMKPMAPFNNKFIITSCHSELGGTSMDCATRTWIDQLRQKVGQLPLPSLQSRGGWRRIVNGQSVWRQTY